MALHALSREPAQHRKCQIEVEVRVRHALVRVSAPHRQYQIVPTEKQKRFLRHIICAKECFHFSEVRAASMCTSMR